MKRSQYISLIIILANQLICAQKSIDNDTFQDSIPMDSYGGVLSIKPTGKVITDITTKDTSNLSGVVASLDLTAGDRKVPPGLLSKRGRTVIAETYYNVEKLELYNTNIYYKK